MKNSTLKKLPIPFIAMCGIGTFFIMSLLIGSSDKIDAEQSKQSQAAEPTNGQAQAAELLETDADQSEVTYSPTADNEVEQVPLSTRDQVKTELVSTGSGSSADGKKYSPDAPDPSVALAEALPPTDTLEGGGLAKRQAVDGAGSAESTVPTAEPINEASVELDAQAEGLVDQSTTAGDAGQLEAATLVATIGEPTTNEAVVAESPVEADAAMLEEPSREFEDESNVATAALSERPPLDTPVDAPPMDAPLDAPPMDARPEPPSDGFVEGELATEDESPAYTTIQNPSFNKLPVWFAANGRNVQLKPGQKFVFPETHELDIRYARGGEFGEDEAYVSEGTWRFGVTRQYGWKLYRLK